MSNVPPPPYGSGPSPEPLPVPRPGWIPASELPGAVGAPPSGTSVPPPFGAPPPVSPGGGAPGRRPSWLLPVAALAVVAVVGLVVWLASGGDDDGGRSTAAAATKLRTALDALELGVDDTVELRRCPPVDLDDIGAAAPSGFDADAALAGEETTSAYLYGDSDDPVVMECLAVSDASAFSVILGASPTGDLSDYVDRFYSAVDVDLGDEAQVDGGTLLPFCITVPDGGGGCEALWSDGRLQVGLFASAADGTADEELVERWLREVLDDVIAGVDAMDPERIEADG